MRRRFLVALVLAACLALAACAPRAVSHPAAKAVEDVLALRRGLVKDAAEYEPFFVEPAVASELASDAAGAKDSPVPDWQPPYVSSEATSSAEVVVVWKGEKAGMDDWPSATLFTLRLDRGSWKISDAAPLTATDTPKPLGDDR